MLSLRAVRGKKKKRGDGWRRKCQHRGTSMPSRKGNLTKAQGKKQSDVPIRTGVACAIFPTSSSACISFFIRAATAFFLGGIFSLISSLLFFFFFFCRPSLAAQTKGVHPRQETLFVVPSHAVLKATTDGCWEGFRNERLRKRLLLCIESCW